MAVHSPSTSQQVATHPPTSSRPTAVQKASRARRCAAVGVAIACLAPLIVAAMLTPSHAGHGTHTQLGLPECGWVTAFNAPCPTCGMTTSFAHAAHGNLLQAFLSQPFGAALAIGLSVVFWGAVHVAATGSRLDRLAAGIFLGRSRGKIFIAVAVAALAAWAYKLVTWTS